MHTSNVGLRQLAKDKVNRFLEEKASEDLLQMKSENMTFFF